jgi:hypothetical protein
VQFVPLMSPLGLALHVRVSVIVGADWPITVVGMAAARTSASADIPAAARRAPLLVSIDILVKILPVLG